MLHYTRGNRDETHITTALWLKRTTSGTSNGMPHVMLAAAAVPANLFKHHICYQITLVTTLL
jgi:hypothetical protein